MMMIKQTGCKKLISTTSLLVVCCLFAVVLFKQAYGVSVELEIRQSPWDTETKRVVAPFYDLDTKEYTEERKEFDMDLIRELFKLIDQFIKEAFIQSKSASELQNFAKKFEHFIQNKQAEYKVMILDEKAEPLIDLYFVEIADKLKEMFEIPNLAGKPGLGLMDKNDLLNKYNQAFPDVIKRLVNKSPVGLYLDFIHATYDSKSILDLALDWIKVFRNAGLGQAELAIFLPSLDLFEGIPPMNY